MAEVTHGLKWRLRRSGRVCGCIAAAILGALTSMARAQLDEPFPPVFELSSLLPEYGGDGSLGLVLNGMDPDDRSGFSVSAAGDVNGDEVADVVIGAFMADPGGREDAGESYVFFGRSTPFPAAVELSSLDGSTGFRLDGIDKYDNAGSSVSTAGDVNGDGIDDFIIGAPEADPGGRSYAGETYIVFGRKTPFPPSIALSGLNGTNGFRLDGVADFDDSARSVAAAGDVNGDGVDDIVIGAPLASADGEVTAGMSYIVFGRLTPFPASIKLSGLNGSTGFSISGGAKFENSGVSVRGVGDVNGDGLADVVIGAFAADPDGRSDAGRTYIVFGRSTPFPASIALADLDGSNGFRLNGIDNTDFSGYSVSSAGDVNGDGVADIVIGAFGADPGEQQAAGEGYIVFGRSTPFPASIELSSLDGATGFRLDGIGAGDECGRAVAAAGDVNGDGVDDLMIGAPGADPGGRIGAGDSYIVFGSTAPFPPSIALSGLDGTVGFRLSGIDANDGSGRSVAAAGDVNGDGVDDLLIGAPWSSPGGRVGAGESYIVFGRRESCSPDLDGNGTLDLFDFLAFVNLFNGGNAAADCDGNGGLDLFDFLCYTNGFNKGC